MIGTTELMIILGVAALIFGSSKLPSIARDVGKALGEVNKAEKEIEKIKTDFTSEIQSSIQAPIESTVSTIESAMQSPIQSSLQPEQNMVPEEKSNEPDDIEESQEPDTVHEPDIEEKIKGEAIKYFGSKFKSKIFR